MSREEHDREDLLREATALIERVSLKLPGRDEDVFVGFRRDGSASFYFGTDRVYHMNSAGELRRAFVDEMQRHVGRLRAALVGGECSVVGQVPQRAEVVGRISAWLDQLAGRIAVARSPRVT